MSENEENSPAEEDTSEKPAKRKRNIKSSTRRDPKKATDYWTKEEMENTKPVPMPKKESDSE